MRRVDCRLPTLMAVEVVCATAETSSHYSRRSQPPQATVEMRFMAATAMRQFMDSALEDLPETKLGVTSSAAGRYRSPKPVPVKSRPDFAGTSLVPLANANRLGTQ